MQDDWMLMPTLEELLLELSLGDLNLDSLVDLLLMSTLVVGIVLNGSGEQGVDKGGLSKTRFASNLERFNVSLQFFTWMMTSSVFPPQR